MFLAICDYSMPPPESFIEHLKNEGYDSRSNRHSNALADVVVRDLLAACWLLREQAARGEIVYQLNANLLVDYANWNVDLVIGASSSAVPPGSGAIRRETPTLIRLALEIKSVMASHRNAIQNRKRDFEAHHEHVHNYNRRSIAAGLLILNASPLFVSSVRTSPLRPSRSAVFQATLGFCVQQMKNVTSSSGSSPYGIDAKGLLLVNMDAQRSPSTAYVDAPPAPVRGDPLHYDTFIQKLCEEYTARFGR